MLCDSNHEQLLSFPSFSKVIGVGALVGGALVPSRFRFQNPALGPFITNASVHLERPRKVSGRCIAVVKRVERERMRSL